MCMARAQSPQVRKQNASGSFLGKGDTIQFKKQFKVRSVAESIRRNVYAYKYIDILLKRTLYF